MCFPPIRLYSGHHPRGGKPMEILAFICIGVVIAVILAVVVTFLLAGEEYKKQQKKPPE